MPAILQRRPAASPLLHDTVTASRLRARLAGEESRLRAAHAAGVGGFSTTQARADAIADAVRDAFAASTLPEEKFAIVAIGGFGRREMTPHSDADLLILHEQPGLQLHAGLKRSLEAFYYLLLDSGIRPDQRVLSSREVLKAVDTCVKTRTALLDMRFLAGNRHLHRENEACVRDCWSDGLSQHVARLLQEGSARNLRHGFAGTTAEPNLKLAAGGLRDHHTLQWLARAQASGPVDPLDSLVDAGLLSAAQRTAVRRAADFLLRVRTSLHLLSRTANDVLTTGDRAKIAAGFEAPGVHSATLLPGEDFSRGLRRHTHALLQATLTACCHTCRQDEEIRWHSLLSEEEAHDDEDFFFDDDDDDFEDDIPF